MPASSELMAGSVSVPPLTWLRWGRLSFVLTHVSTGVGSPPVVMHTKDTVWPGLTTIGSSTSSLMDGEATKQTERLAADGQFDSSDSVPRKHNELFPVKKSQYLSYWWVWRWRCGRESHTRFGLRRCSCSWRSLAVVDSSTSESLFPPAAQTKPTLVCKCV